MKNTIYILFLMVTGLQAQINVQKAPAQPQDYDVIINEDILANPSVFSKLDPQKVEHINVVRVEEKASEKSILTPQVDDSVVESRKSLHVKTSEVVEVKTQAEINEMFNLQPESVVYVEGYPLLENQKIAAQSIEKVEKIKPNAWNGLKTAVVNVCLRQN